MYKIYCTDCQIEASIKITDDPLGNDDGVDVISACFACGSTDVNVEIDDSE